MLPRLRIIYLVVLSLLIYILISYVDLIDDQKRPSLPGCIIIGVRKCGTRALIDMLNLHPQIEKSGYEVHFFDREENYARGYNWYMSELPRIRPGQLSIEKSPSYFVTAEVPERIYEMNSSIKLLLIVREPVTRLISDFTQIYHSNKDNKTLEELALTSHNQVNANYKAIRISMYARYLTRWLDLFSKEQIHVVDGDALVREPYGVVREVERFLGVAHFIDRNVFYFNSTKGFYCWRSKVVHCLNDSKGRRHPVVNATTVKILRRFYRNFNYQFYQLIGRDLAWPET